jgi:BirA family transcriptional regulator, biotin operon repressor / biotin---[acetyl-CoA-carboxylase] ligase
MKENCLTNLGTQVIGNNIVFYKKVTSTNDLAWLEVSRGKTEGVIVLADEQLRGRGRFGRDWFSPANKGIWLSAVMNISQFPADMFLLMAMGAIAVTDLLRSKFNLPASIRWPNDVIINHKKIAGIIIESKCIAAAPNAAVMGIGMNVNITESELPADLKDTTTSIIIEQNKTIILELEPIIRDLICFMDKWYLKIINRELKPIQDAWREFSGVLNKTVTIKVKEESIEGKLVDLDPCKGIALLDDKGNTVWWSGEKVELLRLI